MITGVTGTIAVVPAKRQPLGSEPGCALTRGGGGVHPVCVSRTEVAAGATYQSAERVLTLLTSFDDDRLELGVTEMAASLGVHKSTASRLPGCSSGPAC